MYLKPKNEHQQPGKHHEAVQDDIIQVVGKIAFALPVQGACNDTGYHQQKDIIGGEAIEGEGQIAREEASHRYPEPAGDPFLIEQCDQAPDAVGLVIAPVAIIKDEEDAIDEEEAAGREQDKGEMPLYAGDDQRQHGGDIDEGKAQEEGLADGDLPQLPESALGEFGRRIQKGEKGSE